MLFLFRVLLGNSGDLFPFVLRLSGARSAHSLIPRQASRYPSRALEPCDPWHRYLGSFRVNRLRIVKSITMFRATRRRAVAVILFALTCLSDCATPLSEASTTIQWDAPPSTTRKIWTWPWSFPIEPPLPSELLQGPESPIHQSKNPAPGSKNTSTPTPTPTKPLYTYTFRSHAQTRPAHLGVPGTALFTLPGLTVATTVPYALQRATATITVTAQPKEVLDSRGYPFVCGYISGDLCKLHCVRGAYQLTIFLCRFAVELPRLCPLCNVRGTYCMRLGRDT